MTGIHRTPDIAEKLSNRDFCCTQTVLLLANGVNFTTHIKSYKKKRGLFTRNYGIQDFRSRLLNKCLFSAIHIYMYMY